jgi:heme-degrading monooxygenase HmoA
LTVLAFERYPVEPSSTDAFEELVGRLLVRARAAPGALWADAARAFDDEPSYLVLSEWRTEADFASWEVSREIGDFQDDVDALLRGDITRRRFSDSTD